MRCDNPGSLGRQWRWVASAIGLIVLGVVVGGDWWALSGLGLLSLWASSSTCAAASALAGDAESAPCGPDETIATRKEHHARI
jgi:hypothetical protein